MMESWKYHPYMVYKNKATQKQQIKSHTLLPIIQIRKHHNKPNHKVLLINTKMIIDFTQLFADIEPIPQNDGPHPVCAIDYPEEFIEAMNYLRALMDIDEHSGK